MEIQINSKKFQQDVSEGDKCNIQEFEILKESICGQNQSENKLKVDSNSIRLFNFGILNSQRNQGTAYIEQNKENTNQNNFNLGSKKIFDFNYKMIKEIPKIIDSESIDINLQFKKNNDLSEFHSFLISDQKSRDSQDNGNKKKSLEEALQKIESSKKRSYQKFQNQQKEISEIIEQPVESELPKESIAKRMKYSTLAPRCNINKIETAQNFRKVDVNQQKILIENPASLNFEQLQKEMDKMRLKSEEREIILSKWEIAQNKQIKSQRVGFYRNKVRMAPYKETGINDDKKQDITNDKISEQVTKVKPRGLTQPRPFKLTQNNNQSKNRHIHQCRNLSRE